MKTICTADLCDAHRDNIGVAEPLFRAFGRKKSFGGVIATLKVFEDNSLLRKTLETNGNQRILVVDGGGSLRCALLGDNLAKLLETNHWAGIVIYGCIRDSAVINQMDVGVRALSTSPLKSIKRNEGQVDIPVKFAGVHFVPGHFLYADEDGIIVSSQKLV